jgi:simple sugar transport system permease protein
VVSALVVLLIGENPITAGRVLIGGALGWNEGIGYTLFYTTNFLFTGLAVAVAFHAGLFNIGGEGQAYIAGLGVALIALPLGPILPWYIVFPLAVVGAASFGAAWAFIPAWLRAKRGSHEVITTIMFNFIAASVMVYLLSGIMKAETGMAVETARFAEGATLPMARDYDFLNVGQAPLNFSFLLALVAAVGVWVLIWRTKLGYEIRTMGFNSTAGKYGGISEAKIIIIAMMISGGLAGMMAINEVMGQQNRLLIDFVAGYGFVGIAVALMGRSHPVGILLASLLFGVLYQGGAELAFEMPGISRDLVLAIQGLVILFAGALEKMFEPSLVRLFAPSAKLAAAE